MSGRSLTHRRVPAQTVRELIAEFSDHRKRKQVGAFGERRGGMVLDRVENACGPSDLIDDFPQGLAMHWRASGLDRSSRGLLLCLVHESPGNWLHFARGGR